MISVTASGNIGRDPELKHTQGGTAVLSFSLASNDRQKVDGEWKDVATWLRVTVFGKRAESLANHLGKGSKVIVRGKLSVRDYETKDGKAGRSVDVTAEDLEFIGSRPEGQQQPRGEQKPAADFGDDDDIPF